MRVYQVRGTSNKVELLEMTGNGKVKVRDLFTNEVIETTQAAFQMAFEPASLSVEDYKKIKEQEWTSQISRMEAESVLEKSNIEIVELFGNCTIVAVQLQNGYVLVESYICNDSREYNRDQNVQQCLEQIKKKIFDLETYKLQSANL
ncbi:Gp49 family protein [Neobacillus cucumis]|uniref:Gp49 family protein n=1 Tax=Neobacillus cucumis TaxID=1740721 RepID=UPI0028534288|nr:Gp49 family protein [Neobacillus cucumis]MDR4947134.1 Gp49 family protein [Neobacillus cucumis]